MESWLPVQENKKQKASWALNSKDGKQNKKIIKIRSKNKMSLTFTSTNFKSLKKIFKIQQLNKITTMVY